MSSRRSKNYLKCGHYVSYEEAPPSKGDVVYCAMCRNYSEVLKVDMMRSQEKSWHWICRDPKHGRNGMVKSFPDTMLSCEKSAIAHAKRNHHTVTMYTESQTVYHVYRDHDPNQLSLPVTTDGTSGEYPF